MFEGQLLRVCLGVFLKLYCLRVKISELLAFLMESQTRGSMTFFRVPIFTIMTREIIKCHGEEFLTYI